MAKTVAKTVAKAVASKVQGEGQWRRQWHKGSGRTVSALPSSDPIVLELFCISCWTYTCPTKEMIHR